MKLTGSWINAKGAQSVLQMFEKAGHKAYFVGGCVRNALLGFPVTDVDIATDATPDQTTRLAQIAGIKAIPTGIDHGTVTLVTQGQAYEVTTFRTDIQTDGRHAKVQFSNDIVADAQRRDFTMNALYADQAGDVIDPLEGLDDLMAGRVRFILDAGARISEDFLRILRFFRFSALYANPIHGFDQDALSSISGHLDGLSALSKERVGSEMRKLLGAPDPAPSVAVMSAVGALTQILPGSDDNRLAVLIHLEAQHEIRADAVRRLAAIGGQDVQAALRLSNAETKTHNLLRGHMGTSLQAGELGYRFGKEISQSILLLRAVQFETELDANALAKVEIGSAATFPVTGKDLLEHYSGEALGKKLRDLETRWIASEFKSSRKELLN
jgi:poly(A) polymerase